MLNNKMSVFLFAGIFICLCSIQKPAHAEVPVVKMKWLDSVLHIDNDTTYVLNYWATWCVPCVAELPDFEKIHQEYKGQKVRVILISLDYAKKIGETVIPFLKKKQISAQVVLLNEPDANSWINKVDQSWSGALPATLIVNKSTSYRNFLEKELNFEQLNSFIKSSIIKK